MKAKVITGLLLSAGMFVTLYVGDWLFLIVCLVGVCFGTYEYYKLLRLKNINPLMFLGIPFGMLFVVFAYFGRWNPALNNSTGAVITGYVFLILIIQFIQIMRKRERYGTLDLTVTVFGSIYIGAFLGFAMGLYNIGVAQFPNPEDLFKSRLVIFLPMLAAWGNDAAAFFTGKFLGKNKIFPDLSPKKTLEGSIGGIVIATFFFCLIGSYLDIPIGHSLALGLFACLCGQIGDLSESALKREVGVKDSGNIFGSHGGFLDRIDSFLFTAPVCFHFFLWFRPWG